MVRFVTSRTQARCPGKNGLWYVRPAVRLEPKPERILNSKWCQKKCTKYLEVLVCVPNNKRCSINRHHKLARDYFRLVSLPTMCNNCGELVAVGRLVQFGTHQKAGPGV